MENDKSAQPRKQPSASGPRALEPDTPPPAAGRVGDTEPNAAADEPITSTEFSSHSFLLKPGLHASG